METNAEPTGPQRPRQARKLAGFGSRGHSRLQAEIARVLTMVELPVSALAFGQNLHGASLLSAEEWAAAGQQ